MSERPGRDELAARLEPILELDQRIEVLAAFVRAVSDDVLLDRLSDLVRAAVSRRRGALSAVRTWIVMTVRPDSPVRPRERDLFRAAEARADPLLVTLLQPPFPVVLPTAPPARVVSAKDGRPLTLGERRAAARRRDRLLLDRLAADPDPGVVARLLRNPATTEPDVVRIAAWRPGRPEILAEVLRCDRWAVRPAVQAALVRNPATPVPIAVRLTLLLPLPKLAEVVRDGETSLLVRLACERHLRALGTRKGVPRRYAAPPALPDPDRGGDA